MMSASHSKTVHRETHCRLGPYTLSITVQTAGLEPIQSAGDLEVANGWMVRLFMWTTSRARPARVV